VRRSTVSAAARREVRPAGETLHTNSGRCGGPDLYGTVVNEGANRGIFVTTSGFDPDSYDSQKISCFRWSMVQT
jgi:hypothetical protein